MRFLKFIFSLLAICIAIAIFFEYAFRKSTTVPDYLFGVYYSKINTIETIYIGNSHVGVFTDIYPDSASTSGNMSIGGQDIFRMYTVLKTLVPKTKNLKRVYMGLDYDLVGYNQVKNGDEHYDMVYYPYTGEMYNNTLTNKVLSKSNFFKADRDFFGLLFPAKKKKKPVFIPVASTPTASTTATTSTSTTTDTTKTTVSQPTALPHKTLDPFMCKKRAQEHTLLKYKEKWIPENLQFLENIIKICKANNVELIFFNPPKSDCYRSSSWPKTVETGKHLIDSFTTANKVPYLDYYNDPTFNDDLFVDFDHLNPTGARILLDKFEQHPSLP